MQQKFKHKFFTKILILPQGIEIKPAIGEYWSVSGAKNSFVVVVQENPLKVNYFLTSVKGKSYRLDEEIAWPILRKDLEKKVSAPRREEGRTRTFYFFE